MFEIGRMEMNWPGASLSLADPLYVRYLRERGTVRIHNQNAHVGTRNHTRARLRVELCGHRQRLRGERQPERAKRSRWRTEMRGQRQTNE